MRRNAFLGYLIAQVLVILAVTVIFKVIPDRQIAATIAGFLFVLLPVVLMVMEYRRAQLAAMIWFVGVLQFWTLFALPILSIRLLNWGVPFDALSFLGIPGPVLHQYSSKSYLVMMVLTAWAWYKLAYKSGEEPPKEAGSAGANEKFY
jgi:ABC-type multidrug transport system permease subunit